MFNRFEALKKCIEDKSMDTDVLATMVDFHTVKGTLTADEGAELMALIYPVVEEQYM